MVSAMDALLSIARVVRRILPWALLFVGVFWMSKAVRPTGTFHVGEHLPPFSARLTSGSKFVLPEKPGHVMVVNFWATYCGPCREEAPYLAAAAQRGVNVVGIATDSVSRDALTHAAHDFGMSYPIAFGNEPLLKLFHIHTVPITYVLAPDGSIVLSRVGALQKSELDDALALAEKNARAEHENGAPNAPPNAPH